MTDMQEVVTIEKEHIEKYLKNHKKPFDENEKQFVVALMNFFYASAFCERTCDMNESFYAAQRYKDEASKIYEKVAGKEME